MPLEDAGALLARETEIREASVPDCFNGEFVEANHWRINRDSFLLRVEDQLSFFYRRGEGVIFQRLAHIPDATVELFHHGSVHGAIAWINGLVPLHASAIAHKNRVIAFTGDSGAGKSTIVAGLAAASTPLFADDVLVVDLRTPGAIICLPGHKTLKLCGDAFDLISTERGPRVYPGLEKFYASVSHRSSGGALPLGTLMYLEDGKLAAKPVSGKDRFTAIGNAFYRPEYAIEAGYDFSAFFEVRARLATVPMMRLSRPRTGANFAQTNDFVRQLLTAIYG